MKIGIVGAGAMGCLFAYLLHRANYDIVLYERSDDAVSSVKEEGLNVSMDGKSETIRLPISSAPNILEDSDYIFIFVKSYATSEAIKNITPFIKTTARLISLQNGLGNAEKLKAAFPNNALIYGTTTIGATKTGKASVRLGGMGIIDVGCSSPKELSQAIELFAAAGLSARLAENPDEIIWKKATINAAINPTGAVLGLTNGMLVKNEGALRIMQNIADEAVYIAKASGFSFDAGEMKRTIFDICEKTAANECSMLQDIKAGRTTEIESITGKIILQAHRLGIDAPVNETLYFMIKALENKRNGQQ